MFNNRDIKTQVSAELGYEYSLNNGSNIRRLTRRVQELERMLKVEWSESNKKYYKIDDEDKKNK